MAYNTSVVIYWYVQTSHSTLKTFSGFKPALDCYKEFYAIYQGDNNQFRPVLWSQETTIYPQDGLNGLNDND